jgi:hypothetical protein
VECSLAIEVVVKRNLDSSGKGDERFKVMDPERMGASYTISTGTTIQIM